MMDRNHRVISLAALTLALATSLAAPRHAVAADKTAGVSTDLLEFRAGLLQGKPLPEIARSFPHVRAKDGRVGVSLRCWSLSPEFRRRLEDLGLDITAYSEEWNQVVAWCPPEALEPLAALPEVSTVYPNYRPLLWVGSVTSQADASIRAADARTAFGVDGAGIKVGVLSDSFNDVIGGTIVGTQLTGSAPQATGDLPAVVTVLDNGPGSGTDEGAAMAELVYDLAPGCSIMFHSAFNSEVDFAQGIGQLRAAGSRVLVDDVIYFSEPMYQDGPIAQAVQSAVNAGAVYLSSAGNAGDTGVRETYQDVNTSTDSDFFPPDGTDFHDFGGPDAFADVTVPSGVGFTAILQWNQPFSGSLGPGSETDLDLFVFAAPSAFADVLASSVAAQGTIGAPLGDAIEILDYVNLEPSTRTVYLAVDHYDGVRDGLEFRIVIIPISGDGGTFTQQLPGWSFQPGIFDQPQIFGHAAAAGALAIGAVFYDEIDSDGNEQPPAGIINVEPFSSLGGDIPFYFGPTGIPLPGAPVPRFKPEISAPDGTNTTFFGDDIPDDPDGFPNFFGTSASAPHAAALVALMLDANGTMTPDQVRQALAATARDIEAAGADPLSGAGLVDAVDAVEAATLATPTAVPTATATAVPTATPVATATEVPTVTPVATSTATVTAPATATPQPTSTGVPTATPVSTATAPPTATPESTATPAATPTSVGDAARWELR